MRWRCLAGGLLVCLRWNQLDNFAGIFVSFWCEHGEIDLSISMLISSVTDELHSLEVFQLHLDLVEFLHTWRGLVDSHWNCWHKCGHLLWNMVVWCIQEWLDPWKLRLRICLLTSLNSSVVHHNQQYLVVLEGMHADSEGLDCHCVEHDFGLDVVCRQVVLECMLLLIFDCHLVRNVLVLYHRSEFLRKGEPLGGKHHLIWLGLWPNVHYSACTLEVIGKTEGNAT